jgi:hypothetical protein
MLLFNILIISNLSLSVIDLSQSLYYINNGRAYEVNPILRLYQNKSITFITVKMSADIAVTGYFIWLHKKYPKRALIGLIALNVIKTGVVVHNYQVMRK